jgi:uncharacterized membrane protein
MAHDEPQIVIELGKNRIEALADGIFAIAMTLLVLDFRLPALPDNATNTVVGSALLHLWPKLVSYMIAFLSLGVFWVGHHNMYHGVRRADRTLLWLNIFFFMLVSFVPFSTSLLSAYPRTIVGLLVFGVNLSLIGWVLFFQWLYVCSRQGMIADFHTMRARRLIRDRFLAYPVISCVTSIVSIHNLPISLSVHCLLLPLYMIPGKFNAQEQAYPDIEKDGAEDKEGSAEAERGPSRIFRRLRSIVSHLITLGTMGEEHGLYRKLVVLTALAIGAMLAWAILR